MSKQDLGTSSAGASATVGDSIPGAERSAKHTPGPWTSDVTADRREQIARAICASYYGDQAWDEFSERTQADYLSAADAVLALAPAVQGEGWLTAIETAARIAEGQAEFVAGKTHEALCHSIAKLIREHALVADGRTMITRPSPEAPPSPEPESNS